jgi:hypothetical protein
MKVAILDDCRVRESTSAARDTAFTVTRWVGIGHARVDAIAVGERQRTPQRVLQVNGTGPVRQRFALQKKRSGDGLGCVLARHPP